MEKYVPNIFFAIILIAGIGYFVMNVRKLIRNIKLGKEQQHKKHVKSQHVTMQQRKIYILYVFV